MQALVCKAIEIIGLSRPHHGNSFSCCRCADFEVQCFELDERARAGVSKFDWLGTVPVDSYGARSLLTFWALCVKATHSSSTVINQVDE
jgi:hypothetical protein